MHNSRLDFELSCHRGKALFFEYRYVYTRSPGYLTIVANYPACVLPIAREPKHQKFRITCECMYAALVMP